MQKAALLALALALTACGSDDAPTPAADAGPADANWAGPIERCPGGAGCATASGQLEAGAAKVDTTPDLSRWETVFDDKDGDTCLDDDETFEDPNGNNKMDALWLAGFCNGRPAVGIKTPLSARALALRQGDTSMAVMYVDAVGLFLPFIESIEDDPAVQALGFDLVVIGATHVHEAPDTAGLWHLNQLVSGVDPDYAEQVRKAGVQALVEAHAALAPAQLTVAQVKTVDPVTGDALPYLGDLRDPAIMDPTLTMMRFARQDAPDITIGTLVNWASHPEYTGEKNGLVSADYPHWLRETIEQGDATSGTAGVGGITVFVQGPLGGQIGPWLARPVGPDGPVEEEGHAKAQAAGTSVAVRGLRALEDDGEVVASPDLSFKSAEILARLDNTALVAVVLTDVVEHPLVGYDEFKPIDEDNAPWGPTRITQVQIGPVAFVTMPVELHPELWVGGYDGSWSFGQALLTETINAPMLDMAPAPPYLRDVLLAETGAKYVFMAGLAHDYLGYLVARFNFVVNPDNPYFEEASGDHYEETRAIGPDAEDHIVGRVFDLVRAK